MVMTKSDKERATEVQNMLDAARERDVDLSHATYVMMMALDASLTEDFSRAGIKWRETDTIKKAERWEPDDVAEVASTGTDATPEATLGSAVESAE